MLADDIATLRDAPDLRVGKAARFAGALKPEVAVRIFGRISPLEECRLILPDRETPLDQPVGVFSPFSD